MFISPVEDGQKLVAFYSGFTCVYFPIIICALYFTDYLYSTGKYSFFPVIGIILVAECSKCLIGTHRLVKRNTTGTGRYDERYIIGSTKKNSIKNRLKEGVKSSVIIVIMIVVYFTVAVLFGAEVFSKHEETLMLSVLLCVLTVFPACLHMGANSVINLLFGQKPSNDDVGTLILRNIQLTLFGAWLGAFVIPLDWDRAWQDWPIPCASGAMLGFTAANFLMMINVVPKLSKKNSAKSGRKQH
jgi:phosphatidylinositol glycan class F